MAAEIAADARPGASRSYLAALVEVGEVGDRLGRSRTSLYRSWPSQLDFWADLTVHLVFQNDHRTPDEQLPWHDGAGGAPARGDILTDVDRLRTALGRIQDAVVADPWVLIRASLLGYADVPGVAEARRAVEGRRIRHLGRRIAEILDLGGLAVAPPLRAEDAAAALWCLGDGFAALHRSRPAVGDVAITVDDGHGPRPWGLLAYAVRATLAEMARPGPAAPLGPPPPGVDAAALFAQLSDRWTPAQRAALDTAADIFIARVGREEPAPSAEGDEIRSLGHVTVAAVARAAGVSRRAVYNHWSSSDELRLDLLRWLLVAERRRYLSGLDRVLAARQPAGPARTGAAVTSMLVHPSPDRLPLPHLPLAFLAEAHHPDVRAALEQGHTEMVAAVAARVERLWPADERPSGAVLDAEQVAVSLLALVTGASRLLRVHPAVLRGGATVGRGVPAVVRAFQALLDHRPG